MKSMTGYGKGVSTKDGRTITVELKAVNNRFTEISCKLPKSLLYLDDYVQKRIKSRIYRGSVDVFLTYENLSPSSKKVNVDTALANQYVLAAKKLRSEFMLDDDFGVTALLRIPDVAVVSVPDDDRDAVTAQTLAALDEALDRLDEMRLAEGKTIYDDLNKLINNLDSYLKLAASRAPKVVTDYKKNVTKRVKELLGATPVDEVKLLNEVAFFADKADINEEISRLNSHISQFKSICDDGDAAGRRLDFLSQEMVREANTMGSKSNDLTLTNYVVAMKNEIEKIKEQIRNVE